MINIIKLRTNDVFTKHLLSKFFLLNATNCVFSKAMRVNACDTLCRRIAVVFWGDGGWGENLLQLEFN